MAKGLRSKSKRRFRTLKRQTVVKAPWQLEAEQQTQEAMQAVLDAPKPTAGEGGDAAAAGGMEGMQQGDGNAAMAVDGDTEPMSNPGKLLKKLRKQRLAVTKGIIKGQAKRSQPLAGANQFHKKAKGKKHK